MNAQEFRKAHQEWKEGTKREDKPETPGIWLMAESGWYGKVKPLDLDDTLVDLREKGMPCTIHLNTTSMAMREKSLRIIKKRPGIS